MNDRFIFCLPRWNELPNIDLYLDQVMIIVEGAFAPIAWDREKTVTSTMINNYVKQKMLPPTVKKKYTKQHISDLIMITAFKRALSAAEISVVMGMIKKSAEPKQVHDLFCEMLESGIASALANSANKIVTDTDAALPEVAERAISAVSCKIAFDIVFAEKQNSQDKK